MDKVFKRKVEKVLSIKPNTSHPEVEVLKINLPARKKYYRSLDAFFSVLAKWLGCRAFKEKKISDNHDYYQVIWVVGDKRNTQVYESLQADIIRAMENYVEKESTKHRRITVTRRKAGKPTNRVHGGKYSSILRKNCMEYACNAINTLLAAEYAHPINTPDNPIDTYIRISFKSHLKKPLNAKPSN